MVILDTSVVIDHLRLGGKLTLLRKLVRRSNEKLALSIISIQELYEGKSSQEPERERDLISTVNGTKVLSYSYEIARLAGEFMRNSSGKVKFADAAIAATCLVNDCELATLNTRDFKSIPGLKIVNLETAKN